MKREKKREKEKKKKVNNESKTLIDGVIFVYTHNHGTFVRTMAPNLHIDPLVPAFCVSGRVHRFGLENTPRSPDIQRRPAHSSMDSTKHRKPIRHFTCSDSRAELAIMVIITLRIVRFTRVGSANGGNFYTRDLGKRGCDKL